MLKAVILAGGLGTRLSEETEIKPKPLVEIGGKPILWHIMKYLSFYGIKHFYVCCGYKGYLIKEYFSNYQRHSSDIEVDTNKGKIKILKRNNEDWKVSLIDTGVNTMTGGRLLRLKNYLKKDENFLFTYGDGLSNVDIKKLLEFHKKHKKIATVTAVVPPGRYGAVIMNKKNRVEKFVEKPRGDGGYINGGYFILNKKVFSYLENDNTVWEKKPLENLSKDKELYAFKHDGFWQPMDTLREKHYLNTLWNNGKAKWLKW